MANQKRGGANQKIKPPIVEDGTVRRVLQNTKDLFNRTLVDRVFENCSIPLSKVCAEGNTMIGATWVPTYPANEWFVEVFSGLVSDTAIHTIDLSAIAPPGTVIVEGVVLAQITPTNQVYFGFDLATMDAGDRLVVDTTTGLRSRFTSKLTDDLTFDFSVVSQPTLVSIGLIYGIVTT